ncbi:MAG: tRNA (adenosine(37)-N6)-threonylcarbamoyltransferase complex ATPase subunit type 1 TsaE [Flavobacteriales bacterium]|nr:tRNA (adenosine(37)-N6)-threonylcarbamoyltransferase complex ATPase subunit type 1 TsaE [Flavobacteriales bacterium]
MVLTKEFHASSISELKPVCEFLKTLATEKKIMLFSGEMGAGKTTLIKRFCAHLGIKDEVNSPTFSLVNEYESAIGPVYHFDLYRIRSEEELYDIGYEDYFFSGYLCLVEWPEMASGIIPAEHVLVNIRVENDQRLITVSNLK